VYGQTRNGWLSVAVFLAIDFGPGLLVRRMRSARSRASGVHHVDVMDGVNFERLLADRFRASGWRVTMTPKDSDYGADLILERRSDKVAVQAKRYTSTVGISAVQQVIGAIHHYKASRGMVVTNSHFTPNAIELAASADVELWDRDALQAFLVDTGRGVEAVDPRESRRCPRCGRSLIQRSGPRGQFWGCTGFPKCRYTEQK